MAAPRTDIDPYVEELLIPGEMALSYRRRKAIMAALWRQFPDTKSRGTLNSAIVRVLRERRRLAQGELSKIYVCPDCGGDGKETCHNPDHGFVLGRLGCPGCGHDPEHKVSRGGGCETCEGLGRVTEGVGRRFLGHGIELELAQEALTDND